MSREKELVKNTAVLSLGKFLPKLTSIITLPILTAYLTKIEYGTYDFISTLIMFVIPIASMQIQSAAFRFLIDCRGDKEKSSSIISNIVLMIVPIALAASIIIQFFFGSYSLEIRLLISGYFFFDTINITMGQIARGLGYNKVYSAAAVLLSLMYMVVIIIGVYLNKRGLEGAMLALVIAQIVSSVYIICRIRVWQYISFRLRSGEKLKELLKYSWPMVPNNLSTWVLSVSDRMVITAFLGYEANAVYAVANKIPHMLSLVHSVLVMAWQENASLSVNDADATEYYSKMFLRILKIVFGFTALLIACTPILFAILIRGDYGEAYYQMPVLIFAMFFFAMSAFVGGIYVAHKKTFNVGMSTLFAAIINLIIDFALVNVVGIWAGSISTLVAYMALYFYRLKNCQSFQPLKIHLKEQILLILAIAGMLFLCFLKMRVFNIINFIVGILIFFILNRDLITTVAKRFRRRKKS